jgi:hypothetical protein
MNLDTVILAEELELWQEHGISLAPTLDQGVRFELAEPRRQGCACRGEYTGVMARHTPTCCTRPSLNGAPLSIDIYLAWSPENVDAVIDAHFAQKAPALSETCCGGTAMRATCPYHGPGAR